MTSGFKRRDFRWVYIKKCHESGGGRVAEGRKSTARFTNDFFSCNESAFTDPRSPRQSDCNVELHDHFRPASQEAREPRLCARHVPRSIRDLSARPHHRSFMTSMSWQLREIRAANEVCAHLATTTSTWVCVLCIGPHTRRPPAIAGCIACALSTPQLANNVTLAAARCQSQVAQCAAAALGWEAARRCAAEHCRGTKLRLRTPRPPS